MKVRDIYKSSREYPPDFYWGDKPSRWGLGLTVALIALVWVPAWVGFIWWALRH